MDNTRERDESRSGGCPGLFDGSLNPQASSCSSPKNNSWKLPEERERSPSMHEASRGETQHRQEARMLRPILEDYKPH